MSIVWEQDPPQVSISADLGTIFPVDQLVINVGGNPVLDVIGLACLTAQRTKQTRFKSIVEKQGVFVIRLLRACRFGVHVRLVGLSSHVTGEDMPSRSKRSAQGKGRRQGSSDSGYRLEPADISERLGAFRVVAYVEARRIPLPIGAT
jgi:hypothetical protein